jgi:hypothetical protein
MSVALAAGHTECVWHAKSAVTPTYLSLSRLGGGRLKRYEGLREHATLGSGMLLMAVARAAVADVACAPSEDNSVASNSAASTVLSAVLDVAVATAIAEAETDDEAEDEADADADTEADTDADADAEVVATLVAVAFTTEEAAAAAGGSVVEAFASGAAAGRVQLVQRHSCATQLLSPGSMALGWPDCCKERRAGTCRAWAGKPSNMRLNQSALRAISIKIIISFGR